MKTVKKIAISNNKKNRLRSTLIMITIVLTTMLLTILSTYAYGIIKTNKINASRYYGDYYGSYRNITEEQLKEINRRAEFTNVGIMSDAGIINENNSVHILVLDEKSQKILSLDKQLMEGHFPQKENEIVAQSTFFYKMGYPEVKVGDKVKLPYRKNKKEKFSEHEFVVSGLLEETNQDSNPDASIVLGAEAFVKAQYKPEEINYKAYFKLIDSVQINYHNAESVIKELAKKCGINEENVSVNQIYIMWSKDPGFENIFVCAIIAVCIILFSTIVIYNIFQVGVVEKIQEYGKIRALGATRKQMRGIIFREGMYLTLISTPVGVIFGYIIASVSFDWLISKSKAISSGAGMERVSIFSIPMLLISMGLTFITVAVALRKPMKVVAAISPVEAVRYQEGVEKRRRSVRKGKREVTLFSLALANITANKRRTMATILTMGLSCVLFIALANYTENIDVEYEARNNVEHGQFKLSLDYYFNDEAYPKNNLDYLINNNPLNQDLIKKVRDIKGVTDVKVQKLLCAEENGKPCDISVLDRKEFDRLVNIHPGVGKLDYDEVTKRGGVVRSYAHFLESEGYKIDMPINIKIQDGDTSVSFDTTVIGAFGSGSTTWFITEDTYKQLQLKAKSYGNVWVDCSNKDVEQVEEELNNKLYGVDHISIESFHAAMYSSKFASTLMRSGCYLFLCVIGLIGFMNLANTMIINIITKKQEYGVLQAVGMTNRQLNRSLQLQGIIFTAGTTIVALAVGIPSGYGLFQYAKKSGTFGIHNYHFPIVPVVGIVLVLVGMQIILSLILSRNVKKEAIVDRIRCQG